MSLAEEIARIGAYVDNPPPSEAATRHWVIDPLLRKLGYAFEEIVPEEYDPSRQKPDYTLLPNDSAHTWFLEAKAWARELQDDSELNRAVNYANSAGKRWVVLTNGREWRLYDNYIRDRAPAERIVAAASLHDPEKLERFLSALTKPSVTSGELERYAVESRLAAILEEQLKMPDSAMVEAICSVLRSQFGLAGIQGPIIAAYFQQWYLSLSKPPLPEPLGSAMSQPVISSEHNQLDRSTEQIATSNFARPLQPASITEGQSLENWFRDVRNRRKEAVIGKKPVCLTFPDSTTVHVTKWKELDAAVVRWIGEKNRLPPLPFCGAGGHQYFVNDKPYHERGDRMYAYEEVRFGIDVVYVFTNMSADDHIKRLHALCLAAGEPPSGFILKLS